ncbi:high affinity immunoglobulin epsilon receptor subunit gamma-like [Pungitius pungitius]|uniref:high affinity immunoglobulin epsilon receptor subunit gamma-like n=1 Tax=Pungitius pungitius TaxID=134920 RepID=UPI002E0D1086
MGAMRTGVLVVFGLLVPVASSEIFFTDPVICYFLDSILVVYCIVATALLFREKFSHIRSVIVPEENDGIYQELQRPEGTDAYQEIKPSKEKKKAAKKNKTESAQAASLILEDVAPPPLSAH